MYLERCHVCRESVKKKALKAARRLKRHRKKRVLKAHFPYPAWSIAGEVLVCSIEHDNWGKLPRTCIMEARIALYTMCIALLGFTS